MPKAVVVLASSNRDKLLELESLLAPLNIAVVAGPTFGSLEVDETEKNYVGNARLKARAWHGFTGLPALADDSGLEVQALGGAPGVLSARMGDDDAGRIAWLLEAMRGQRNRRACFVASLVLVAGDREWEATGVCWGTLTEEPRGEGGFGYDPLFIPDGETRTFAEMAGAEKARCSHRARASRLLARRLDDPFVLQYLLDCSRTPLGGLDHESIP